MADLSAISTDDAITFMVAAGLVYEIIAAACSSPQTAEINYNRRATTLMKWVKIGLLQSALFVLIAATVLKGGWPAVWGGVLAGALMGWSYWYAGYSGQRNGAPGTEA